MARTPARTRRSATVSDARPELSNPANGGKQEARLPPGATSCEQCPLRALAAYRAFAPEELAFVKSFKSGELAVDSGATILRDGSNSPHLYTVLSGWGVRYKVVGEGRRQVLNFALPGDLLGLQAALFKELDHSVDALTDMRLCILPRQRLWELFRGYPGLAFDVTWLASREESILADHLASVGQRPAFARAAYMILYLFDRARRAGLVRGNRLLLPLTQQDLADAMGLSIVHTNKTLKRLRATGWLVWTRNELIIRNEDRLREVAEYDPVERGPRPFI